MTECTGSLVLLLGLLEIWVAFAQLALNTIKKVYLSKHFQTAV